MKGRGPLLIAILLGVGAALLYELDLNNAKKKAREGWELQPVVVAAQDIDEGATLSPDMVAQYRIPRQFVTASVIQPENYSFVIGQKVLVTLRKGDPLLWTQFESSKGLERLSKAVQKNFRAITLPANDGDSVGGWIRPNDHVDVMLTYRDTGSEMATVTILQDVLVLATGKITGTTNTNLLPEDQRKYSNVTVLTLPEEAEMIGLGQSQGRISLVLRNDEDLGTSTERTKTTLQTLLTGEREKVLATRRKELQHKIEVLRGIEK